MRHEQIDASPAFQKCLEQSRKLNKRWENNRKGNVTEEHRLFNESEARQLRRERENTYMEKCANAVARRKGGTVNLSPTELKSIPQITGGEQYLDESCPKTFSCLASNPYARSAFFDGAYSKLKSIWQQPSAKMYFATFIDRDWCLKKGTKSFDLSSMRDRAEAALKEISWDGVLFVEIQAVTNMGEYKFLAHLHGFVWPKASKGLGCRQGSKVLNQRFQGVGESKGVTLGPVKQSLTDALPTRFFYATKLPDVGKSYSPEKGEEHSFILDTPGKMKNAHKKNYTNLDALRITRMLAQHKIGDTVFAVGKGRKVREAGARALTAKVENMKGVKADPTSNRVLTLLSKLLRDTENVGDVKTTVGARNKERARVMSAITQDKLEMNYLRSMKNMPNSPKKLNKIYADLNYAGAEQLVIKNASYQDATYTRDALSRFFEEEKSFYDLAFSGLNTFPVSPIESETIRLGIGYGQRGDDPRVWRTAANPFARAALGLSFNKIVTKWAQKTKRVCYTVTFIKKEWQTTRANSVIDYSAMKTQIKEALADTGYEGMLALEIQGMQSNVAGVHPHFHGVISPRKKNAMGMDEALMKLKKAFPDFDGVAGVEISRCKDTDEIEHFMMFALRSSDSVKSPYKDSEDGGSPKACKEFMKYSPRFALDILAIRSLLSLPSLVFTHGRKFENLKEEILLGTTKHLDGWGVTYEKSGFTPLRMVWNSLHLRSPYLSGARFNTRKAPLIHR